MLSNIFMHARNSKKVDYCIAFGYLKGGIEKIDLRIHK